MSDSKRKELRELAASSRFSKAWDLLSSRQETDVMNGVRGIKRMLENRSLSFVDVMQAMLHDDNSLYTSKNTHKGSQHPRAHSAYGGMHGDPFPPRPRPVRPAHREPPIDGVQYYAKQLLDNTTFSSEGLPIVGGSAIPTAIDGVPAIIARQNTPYGEIVLFCVVSQGSCYGPIISITAKTNEQVTANEKAIKKIRVHINGPYSQAPVPVANRIFPGPIAHV